MPFEDNILRQIIDKQLIEMHFQPIVSVRKRKAAGVEALARFQHPASGEVLSPLAMFAQAAKQGLTVELDRLCRIKALQSFKTIALKNPDLLLFLNLDTSIIDQGVVGSGHLINAVDGLGIKPQNVVIEINEAKVSQCHALQRFIETYKGYGFLMALDDLGLGHSNLDRILHVKPNIIKLDRCLIQNLDQDYYKQEICEALVHLSRKIGAAVVAECVETMAEVTACLDLGIEMLQGYYFARPQKINNGLVEVPENQTAGAALLYKELKTEKTVRERLQWAICCTAIDRIIAEIEVSEAGCFDVKLKTLIGKYPMLEYVYILDMKGRQVTETIGNQRKTAAGNKLFQPDCKGTDQSLKDYYLRIQAGWKRQTTEPYMSLATGNLCITNSTVFSAANGEQYILCTDFNPGFFKCNGKRESRERPCEQQE
ncbi:MAG: EAL domain-containing protein [Bacillota bacterium]